MIVTTRMILGANDICIFVCLGMCLCLCVSLNVYIHVYDWVCTCLYVLYILERCIYELIDSEILFDRSCGV